MDLGLQKKNPIFPISIQNPRSCDSISACKEEQLITEAIQSSAQTRLKYLPISPLLPTLYVTRRKLLTDGK